MTIAASRNSLQARVLRAGRQLFLAKGFNETRTCDIAQTAGTSESGLVRAFGDKFGILKAVHQACWAEICEAVFLRLNGSDCPPGPGAQILEIGRTIHQLYESPLRDAVVLAMAHCGTADILVSRKEERPFNSPEREKFAAVVEELCELVVIEGSAPAGTTVHALTEVVLSFFEGSVAGWYSSDRDGNAARKVEVGELLALLAVLVSPAVGTGSSSSAQRKSCGRRANREAWARKTQSSAGRKRIAATGGVTIRGG